jgi:hypothetical protein
MANQDVLAIQRQINASGWRDPNGNALVEDGLMGPRTMAAMQEYNSRAPSVGMGDLRAAEAQTPSGYGSNSRFGMDFGPLLQPIGGKPTQTPTGQTYVKPATPVTPSIPQRGATTPATEGYRDVGAAMASPTYNQPIYAPSRSSVGGVTRTNTIPAKPETRSSLPADYDAAEIARRVAVAEAIERGQRMAKEQERTIQGNVASQGMGYGSAGYANLSALANRLWAKVNEPTSYDVEGHPIYQAAKARAKRQSAEGSSQIVQQMAARNLGKSSITRDRIKGLERQLLERLETETVPLVQSQIAADRQSQISGLMNAYNAQMGAENFRRSGIESELANQLRMAQMGQDYDLAQRKLAQADEQFGLTYQQKEADRQLRERLGIGSLNLQGASQALAQARFTSDQEWRKWLKEKGVTAQQGDIATSGYISQVLGLESPEDAFSYIVENAGDIVNDGANVTKILQQFRTRWPEYYRNQQLDALLGLMKQE